MPDNKLERAVREISESPTTAIVGNAAKDALRDGSNEALTRALVTARECGKTVHVIHIANESLGFE